MKFSFVLVFVLSSGCTKSADYNARKTFRQIAKEAQTNIKKEMAASKKKGVQINLDFFDSSLQINQSTKTIDGYINYSLFYSSIHYETFLDHRFHLEYKDGVWIILSRDDRDRSSPPGKKYFNGGTWGREERINKVANSESFSIGLQHGQTRSQLQFLKH